MSAGGMVAHLAHWAGYVAWCTTSSDPACRPFVGLLALLGASGCMTAIVLLALFRMLRDGLRELHRARAPLFPAHARRAEEDGLPAMGAMLVLASRARPGYPEHRAGAGAVSRTP